MKTKTAAPSFYLLRVTRKSTRYLSQQIVFRMRKSNASTVQDFVDSSCGTKSLCDAASVTKGYLETKRSQVFEWQTFFVELRDGFLLFFKDDDASAGERVPVDMARLSDFDTVALSNTNITLSSSISEVFSILIKPPESSDFT
jgi:hypothetical protein